VVNYVAQSSQHSIDCLAAHNDYDTSELEVFHRSVAALDPVDKAQRAVTSLWGIATALGITAAAALGVAVWIGTRVLNAAHTLVATSYWISGVILIGRMIYGAIDQIDYSDPNATKLAAVYAAEDRAFELAGGKRMHMTKGRVAFVGGQLIMYLVMACLAILAWGALTPLLTSS
jgi:hypothetical protein